MEVLEKILVIFMNTAYDSNNKVFFLSNSKITAVFLALFTNEKYAMKMKSYISQFFINFTYKCNGAISLFKKNEIIMEFEAIFEEKEREIDKMLEGEEGRDIQDHQVICENLRDLLNVLK